MSGRTLSERLEPILRRPGMYVGLEPIKLLWYLRGMLDLEGHFVESPSRVAPLHLALAERLQIGEDLEGAGYFSKVEELLSQGDVSASMKIICDVTRELLIEFDRWQRNAL